MWLEKARRELSQAPAPSRPLADRIEDQSTLSDLWVCDETTPSLFPPICLETLSAHTPSVLFLESELLGEWACLSGQRKEAGVRWVRACESAGQWTGTGKLGYYREWWKRLSPGGRGWKSTEWAWQVSMSVSHDLAMGLREMDGELLDKKPWIVLVGENGWAGLGWAGGGGRPDKTGETSTSVQKLPLADELLAGWSHPPYRSSC